MNGNGVKENNPLKAIGHWLAGVPHTITQLASGKLASLQSAFHLGQSAQKLVPGKDSVKRLRRTWKDLAVLPVSPLAPEFSLSAQERRLVERIRLDTQRKNRNNVTRTRAYWNLYEQHPELHWALLAHMVSRNGGWNMTDLEGEFLPALLKRPGREALFAFLERANALIFGDAYPQLLLYEESKRSGEPLFHLLPAFGVSVFMRPVWEEFWAVHDPVLLTVSLIVNEQHFIESRVVKQQYFITHVMETAEFQAQALLQLNQVFFPFALHKDPMHKSADRLKLAGEILEDFTDIKERIGFGKTLYAILFGIPAVHQGVVLFASAHPHTGSRADYWPHLFSRIRKDAPGVGAAGPKLEGCELKAGAAGIYSPELERTWKDVPLTAPEPGDWFPAYAESVTGYFGDIDVPALFEMSAECCFGLHKIQLAALASTQLKGD
ncbi:DUF2515 family protein [Paenibacillus sp. RC84]|uniref:DUF2515 family protein n=1 Tax=Paenibacillus sp. RC84 TaxID=3156252 RepID=UPI003513D702